MNPINLRKNFSTELIDEYTTTLEATTKTQLDTLYADTLRARKEKKHIEAWYTDNLLRIVKHAIKGEPRPHYLKDANEIDEITVSTSDIDRLQAKLDRLTFERPQNTFRNILNRYELKSKYMKDLLDNGQEIINEATNLYEETQNEQTSSFNSYEKIAAETIERYKNLAKASEGDNIDLFVSSMQSLLDQSKLKKYIIELLYETDGRTPSLIEKIMSNMKGEEKKENELAQKVLTAFAEEDDAYLFAIKAHKNIWNADIKKKWSVQTDKFAGAFLPLPYGGNINVMNCTRLKFKHNRLNFINGNDTFLSWPMSKRIAVDMLEQLSQRPGMLSIDEKNLANISRVMRLTFQDDELVLYYKKGVKKSWDITRKDAEKILGQAEKFSSFRRIGHNTVCNLSMYNRIDYDNNRLKFIDADNREKKMAVTATEAQDLFDEIATDPTFVSLASDGVINAANQRRAEFSPESIVFIDTQGNPYSWDCDQNAIEDVQKRLLNIPSYYKIDDHHTINTDLYKLVTLDSDHEITLYDTNETNIKFSARADGLEENDIRTLYDSFAKRPNFYRINSHNSLNVNSYKFFKCEKDDLLLYDNYGTISTWRTTQNNAQKALADLGTYPTYFKLDDNNVLNCINALHLAHKEISLICYFRNESTITLTVGGDKATDLLKRQRQVGQKFHEIEKVAGKPINLTRGLSANDRYSYDSKAYSETAEAVCQKAPSQEPVDPSQKPTLRLILDSKL